MRVPVRVTPLVALACGLGMAAGLTVAAPASADPNVNVNWDCEAYPPIGSASHLTLASTIDTTAPAHVAAGDIFEAVLAARPLTLPSEASGYHLNSIRNVKLRIPVPSGATLRGVSLSGGANIPGTPTVSQANGVVTLSISDKISGGSTFQFPAVHLSLTASGVPGTSIETKVSGTSYSDPGLEFTAQVHVSPGIDPDVPAKCFPNPSPALSSTVIDEPAGTPAGQSSPTLATSGKRTLAVQTAADGHVFVNWWDLGGGGVGWRELPGGFVADGAPAATLVANGDYAFIVARSRSGSIFLNQGTPGGSWVGWQPMNITSKYPPAAAASGNKSVVVVVDGNGQLSYTWWDLGGGATGWHPVPGGLTDAAPAVSLVDNDYFFFYEKNPADGHIWLNQGRLGKAIVGWQQMTATSNVAPGAGSSGKRSYLVVTGTDGRVRYDWWDLGGGGRGFREIPGGFRSDAAPAAGLVDNGNYVFVMAKDAGTGAAKLNQGVPKAQDTWVGWL
jgi:dehydratase